MAGMARRQPAAHVAQAIAGTALAATSHLAEHVARATAGRPDHVASLHPPQRPPSPTVQARWAEQRSHVVQPTQRLITNYFPIIRRSGNDFEAYLTVNQVQQQVGHIEIEDYDDDGRMWLFYVETDANFRRRGIATALMRAAVQYHGAIYVSQAGQGDHEQRDQNDTRWLTQDGAALVNSCVQRGILRPEWLVNPFWDEDSSDFDDDEW